MATSLLSENETGALLAQMPKYSEMTVSELAEVGAGIEITQEMVDAGARVLCSFETFTADEAYWARLVYLAMRIASAPK